MTQVVACYDETILETSVALRSATRRTGGKAALEHLVITYPTEWKNFYLRTKNTRPPLHSETDEKELLRAFLVSSPGDFNGKLEYEVRLWASNHSQTVGRTSHTVAYRYIPLQVRLWASNRSQTVGRTIRGAVSAHQVLARRHVTRCTRRTARCMLHVARCTLHAACCTLHASP